MFQKTGSAGLHGGQWACLLFDGNALRGEWLTTGYQGVIFNHNPFCTVRAQQPFDVFGSALVPRIIRDDRDDCDQGGDPDGEEGDHHRSTRHSVLPLVGKQGFLQVGEVIHPHHINL